MSLNRSLGEGGMLGNEGETPNDRGTMIKGLGQVSSGGWGAKDCGSDQTGGQLFARVAYLCD